MLGWSNEMPKGVKWANDLYVVDTTRKECGISTFQINDSGGNVGIGESTAEISAQLKIRIVVMLLQAFVLGGLTILLVQSIWK